MSKDIKFQDGAQKSIGKTYKRKHQNLVKFLLAFFKTLIFFIRKVQSYER